MRPSKKTLASTVRGSVRGLASRGVPEAFGAASVCSGAASV
jgi:hypothetical protein